MNNILIVCNTVLQVIFATNLKYSEFKDDNVDLAISDHMNNAQKISLNAQKVKQFENVYFIQTKHYLEKIQTEKRLDFLRREYLGKSEIEQIILPKRRYDYLLVANSDKFSLGLYEYLKKSNNHDIRYRMYEDGLSAYCVMGSFLERQRMAEVSKLHSVVNSLAGKIHAFNEIECMYFFKPELVQWDLDIPFKQMKHIDKYDKNLIDTLNLTFDYDNSVDRYDRDYIFFEESYYVEGTDVDDIGIVDYIANIIGKDNIMIKIHPRNPVNRFKKLGYKTNKDTSIPWELIMLNENFEKKTLISIASGSMANPYIIMDMDIKSIVLLKCVEGNFGKDGDIYNDFLLNKVYLENPNIFKVPETMDELKLILSS